MAGRRPHPKNNPDIHGNEGLIRSFVVRLHDYELALRSIRENTASDSPNQHVLFTGPRGAGKTMLVRRRADT
jgi:predicted AAA+ superfamily ATPase